MAKKPLVGTLDLETDPFQRGRIPVPFAADAYIADPDLSSGGLHRTFWGADCHKQVLEYIIAHPRIWYAHNGGKFDFHFILNLLPRDRIKKLLTINGRVVQVIFHGAEQFELRDSYALIPRALREWAKEDIDITKLEREVRETHRHEIIAYLKKDTEYLHEMLDAFISEYGMHLTLASAAFKILHKDFGVKRVHISEHQDAKFRPFYFAGRVEFYALGNLGGGFTVVDINSSFPHSMTKDHWEGDGYVTLSRLPVKNLRQSFIHLECESHGAFPFREEDGSVSFPDGGERRAFYITGWEYEAALELGLLVRAKIFVSYVPISIRDYSEYINHFSRIKERADETGNKGERLFAKLLMNSGYGKFGMDPREHEEVMLCDWRTPPDGDDWTIQKDDEANGITLYKRPAQGRANRFNNVCVAASITGCSRAALLRARQICGGVAYCDTDSLIARDVSKLPIGAKLGEWKIEANFSRFYIGGKKLYAGYDPEKVNPVTKAKGLWKTASKGTRLTPEQIIAVAEGSSVTYEFEAPSFSIRGITRFTKRTVTRADKRKVA